MKQKPPTLGLPETLRSAQIDKKTEVMSTKMSLTLKRYIIQQISGKQTPSSWVFQAIIEKLKRDVTP